MPLVNWAVIVISIMLMSNIVLTMTEIKMQPASSRESFTRQCLTAMNH